MYEHSARAASIRADFLKKQLQILNVRSGSDLKTLLKKFGRLTKYKIIVSLDSHLASTMYSSIVLPREHHQELIDEPELDNLISQAIWKFFDRSRNKVAGKMGVADLDIMLTDVRIRGIKLDGHKVVNPIGFKARTVEVQFSQTFLSRGFIDSIKELVPLSNVVLISENGTAWASVIAKGGADQKFLLANLYPSATKIFLADGSQNAFYDHVRWGENHLKQAVGDNLGVDSEIAGLIIGRYMNAGTSETFRRRLEAVIMKEMLTLAHALEVASKKSDTRLIYLHPFFQAPNLFSANFRNQFDRSVQLQPLTLDLISQKFGFAVTWKHSADAQYIFSMLAALIEWYLSPHDDKMSQLAKRRVRWLSPV